VLQGQVSARGLDSTGLTTRGRLPHTWGFTWALPWPVALDTGLWPPGLPHSMANAP
jgi:hypothetical protein